VLLAEAQDLFGIGGDEDVVEFGTGAGGFVDPGEHGAAGDLTENLARETGGGEAGGDDGKGAEWLHKGANGLTLKGMGLIIKEAALVCLCGLKNRD